MLDDQKVRPAPVESIRVPAEVYPYSAGVYGGLVGGLGMVLVALAYGLVSGRSAWYPVNLIAATLLRAWQQASPGQLEQFSLAGLIIGLALHLLVATVLGLVFAVLLPTLPGPPVLWAFIVGPFLWVGALYVFLPILNPAMASQVDPASFGIANIIYSLVLGVLVIRTPKIPAD